MGKNFNARVITGFCALALFLPGRSFASDLDQQLARTAAPYIKYFQDRSLGPPFAFVGLTRSFQLYLGGQSPEDEAIINYGAAGYDSSILGRIRQAGNDRTILDTYAGYAAPLNLADPDNPLINCSGAYYGAGGPADTIVYGLYRVVRILGRDVPVWWNTWDWIVDTGAAACFIVDALDAYQKTSNTDYRDFAVLLGGHILKLQDTDGGNRYGPRGMYHDPEGASDFYWKLKSTEQNERCLYAFEALYAVTADNQYSDAIAALKTWLKAMYNKEKHLFHTSAEFDGAQWIKSSLDTYVATDVTAFAPIDMMFSDTYFGLTQSDRDAEVDAMFSAIEVTTGFLNTDTRPVFFRFTNAQSPDPVKGDYGSVEWSAQMALAYLRSAQNYAARDSIKARIYLDKYNTLIDSLENYFSIPGDDPESKVAPYASYYLDQSVAAKVPTGTGYDTYNCQAALASCYYAFARSGYDPTKIGGGAGIPSISSTPSGGDGGGGGGGSCFIATAAFGSYDSDEVRVLRAFRDRRLLPHAWGRKFVAFYYARSPSMSRYIEDKPVVKMIARRALKPVVGLLNACAKLR